MHGPLVLQSPEQDLTALKYLELLNGIFSAASIKPFAIQLWNGVEWHYSNEPPHFTLKLKHPDVLRRLLWQPSQRSLGEAFIFNDFDIHGDVEASFELAEYLTTKQWRLSEKMQLLRKLLCLPVKLKIMPERGAANLQGKRHSSQRDAQAIQYHYNISNDFYRLWLDSRMVYSCAYFHSREESLDGAQTRKLDYICRKLRLKPGEKLLDIGCGWGGLIIYAAEHYGVEALGITLSQAQADFANSKILASGLSDHCRVVVCDYRDVPTDQRYDKLVSIGMFEHVGEKNLPVYFQKAFRLLKPGGVFLNHGITQSMTEVPNKRPSFIDKYVFPDGELLPISTSLRVAEESGFEIRDVESLREHYAMTLRHWGDRLEANREKAIALTCEETYRVWQIYMAGSAYSFETGRIGLCQSLFVKSGRNPSQLPLTRCDWYGPCPNRHH